MCDSNVIEDLMHQAEHYQIRAHKAEMALLDKMYPLLSGWEVFILGMMAGSIVTAVTLMVSR